MSLIDGPRKICVAGCSVSDYTRVENTYGELLAKSLNFNYLHEGAGCGSNYRIWRRITNLILDGELTSNDIIIIQYTEVTRTEFYTSLATSPNWSNESPEEDPSYDGGRIIRFKMGSHNWQPYIQEKIFHKAYEQYFVNEKFSLEMFKINNFNFQHMLSSLSMKVIFFDTTRIGSFKPDEFKNNFCLDNFKPLVFKDPTAGLRQYDLENNDWCHLNQLGHEKIAESLEKHIRDSNLL